MKKTLPILVLILLTKVSLCQDLIIKKSGDLIKAKVIEIGDSIIKYKKFENKNGPTYNISVAEIKSINYENGTKENFGIDEIAQGKCRIYFLRSTGYQASAVGYNCFIGNKLLCKLNNKKYFYCDVDTGTINIAVQPPGVKKLNEKTEKLEIKTESGKTYYCQLILQIDFWTGKIYFQEITKNSADKLLKELKEDNCQ